jgi:protein gp37
MAKDSRIEWTHHTFNPWWGCVKVSPACANCYAETWAHRLGAKIWGRHAPRRFFGDEHWKHPLRWNAEAERDQVRRRVFCASMADVFEVRAELNPWRARLWPLIEQTPWLDWLLLTKRPKNVRRMAPWGSRWPHNVWLGTTAENQKHADLRIPELLESPARIHFISAEPLIGPLSIARWSGIDWVIAGGESGHHARPTDPEWVRSLRDECHESGIAFHFKQWGHWAPELPHGITPRQRLQLNSNESAKTTLYGLGKSIAGRALDGRTWDQFPA